MKPRPAKSGFILVLSLLISFSCLNARQSSDTTYHYFFSFRKIPFEIRLTQTGNLFKLVLKGPTLTGIVEKPDPKVGGASKLNITDFTSDNTASDSTTLPASLTFDQFAGAVRMIMVTKTTVSDTPKPELLDLYVTDSPLNNSLAEVYSEIKGIQQSALFREKGEQQKKEGDEKLRKANEAHQATFDSLVNIIDEVDEEHRYGGQFELVDKDSTGVPIYLTRPRGTAGYVSYDTSSYKFYVNTILVKTFNNFIDVILVDGTAEINKVKHHVSFYNGDFSIPLKHTYERSQYLAFTIEGAYSPSAKKDSTRSAVKADTAGIKTAELASWSQVRARATYLVNVSDLIRVSAYKKNFTFMVKNDAYLLTRADKVVPYERRSFYDYLSFTSFMDFLGTIEKTPNSLIQLEGRIRLPLKLINSNAFKSKEKKYIYSRVFIPKVDAYLNAAFINGSQGDDRIATIYNQSTNSSQLDTLYIDNFDLVRRNSIRTGIELGLVKSEMKSYNLNFYLDYGIHFFRTNLVYTIVNTTAPDEQNRFNTWSWTHGPIGRFEYRPDQNIGMDISFAVNFNQRLLNSSNDNLRVFEVKGPVNPNMNYPDEPLKIINRSQRANYKLEFNAYFMTNPSRSNGGLYFRLSNYFNYNFKQLFPQVMVGYSTRLSGMIKNIRSKPVTTN